MSNITTYDEAVTMADDDRATVLRLIAPMADRDLFAEMLGLIDAPVLVVPISGSPTCDTHGIPKRRRAHGNGWRCGKCEHARRKAREARRTA